MARNSSTKVKVSAALNGTGDYKRNISPSGEKTHIANLELLTDSTVFKNKMANKSGWYGARLNFIMKFYGRSLEEVAYALRTYISKVSMWANNGKYINCNEPLVPSPKELEKLCFFFEIDSKYFTEPVINIRITEQIKIEVI